MTAAERRCVHEMLLGQCSICSKHPDDRLYDTKAQQDPAQAEHQPADAPRMQAYRAGGCPGCGTHIRIGDTIVKSLEEGVWVCASCGEGS